MDRDEIEKRWEAPDSPRLSWENAKSDIKFLLSELSKAEARLTKLIEAVESHREENNKLFDSRKLPFAPFDEALYQTVDAIRKETR